MIRSKTVEIRETDLETANNLLKDPHWTFVTAVVDNNAQKVKYVLKRKGTYDGGSSNNSKVNIDLTVMAENALKRAVTFKDKISDFIDRQSEMIDYASRDETAFPDEVRNQTIVDRKKLAKAINNMPSINISPTIRNLKLSELIYIFSDKDGGD